MTKWSPLPQKRKLEVAIKVVPFGSHAPFEEHVHLDGADWRFSMRSGKIHLESSHTYAQPDDLRDLNLYGEAVRHAEKAVAYARSLVTFSFELPTYRGFESFVGEIDDFLPSCKGANSYVLSKDAFVIGKEVLGDIGKQYDRDLHRLLEFWRRAYELEEMEYYAEAYLNYYKIIESMQKRVKQTPALFNDLKDRFRAQCQANGLNEKDLNVAARLFSHLAYPEHAITFTMFSAVCSAAHLRSNFNVGHAREAYLTNDYSASGQFSDDFDLLEEELGQLRDLSKVMILHSKGLREYYLDNVGGSWILKRSQLVK